MDTNRSTEDPVAQACQRRGIGEALDALQKSLNLPRVCPESTVHGSRFTVHDQQIVVGGFDG